MKRRTTAIPMTAFAALLTCSAAASAQPSAPQPNSPCAQDLAGALTQLPGTVYLECRSQDGGYQWQTYGSPYPSSDRWFSYGPDLVLHGEGQRNREVASGDWTGYPQDPASRCNAQQVAVLSAGVVTAPQVSTGEPGQPLRLQFVPLLFTVELGGNCLWQKA
jgi:hypothetical protein